MLFDNIISALLRGPPIENDDRPGWLNAAPASHSHEQPKELAQLVDNDGALMVDIEYCRLGVKEGWIRLDGWYRDSKANLVYRYFLI